MIIRKYYAVVSNILNPVEDLYLIEFDTFEECIKYKPGQFLHLSIDKDYTGIDQWPESRCFSIFPSENPGNISIVYSVKGNYTMKMRDSLKIGSYVWIKLPYGNLFSDVQNKQDCVFIAGGTGVSPFMSLFYHTTFYTYLNPTIYLGLKSSKYDIYSFMIKNAFEKNKIPLENYLLYHEDNEGLLNIDEIFAKHGQNKDYFISGPPEMILKFVSLLRNNGVNDKNIHFDKWD